jgi:hypothetical protein
MGFRVQLDAIMGRLPKQRRTGLFSATQTVRHMFCRHQQLIIYSKRCVIELTATSVIYITARCGVAGHGV